MWWCDRGALVSAGGKKNSLEENTNYQNTPYNKGNFFSVKLHAMDLLTG